ncbi:MAG: hypothetical protein Q8O91_12535, partial [Candidatus Aminicenantes bacterium]|nr:hypothetical protein [Candidatus Aminicenantes bacterium]
MNPTRKLIGVIVAALFVSSISLAQKIEIVDGVRVVHNAKGGLWGRSPKVTLTKVGTLGDVEATDPNLAFTMPSDL